MAFLYSSNLDPVQKVKLAGFGPTRVYGTQKILSRIHLVRFWTEVFRWNNTWKWNYSCRSTQLSAYISRWVVFDSRSMNNNIYRKSDMPENYPDSISQTVEPALLFEKSWDFRKYWSIDTESSHFYGMYLHLQNFLTQLYCPKRPFWMWAVVFKCF